jgi:membrane protein DedA with SNARE-associated domain
MFLLGKKLGYPFLQRKFARKFIGTKNLGKAEDAFDKYGDGIFFVARFLPGLRTPIYFTGGALNARFYKFFLFDSFAAIISVPVWIFGAYYGGEYLERVIDVGKNVQFAVIGFIVLLTVIILGWRFYRNRNSRKK